MSRLEWGLAVWGGWFFLLTFLPVELLAHYWAGCPWPTLSDTVWVAIKDWHPVAYGVAIVLFVLWGHFVERWSVGWLIAAAAALVVAVLIHLATR